MKEKLFQLVGHIKTGAEKYKELWQESMVTKIVTIGILAVVVIILIITSIGSLFEKGSQNNDQPATVTDASIENISENKAQLALLKSLQPTGTPVYGVEQSVQLDYQVRISLKELGADKAVLESLRLGQVITDIEDTNDDIFLRHIEILRRMRSYTRINTQTLMQEATDRVNTLQALEEGLTIQLEIAEASINELIEEIRFLRQEVSIHDGLKNEANTAYRKALENFDSEASLANLRTSIKEQALIAELTTKQKVLERFVGIYRPLKDNFTLKLKFIAANREALLKNVIVVDIRGVEEDLIISEGEWRKLINR